MQRCDSRDQQIVADRVAVRAWLEVQCVADRWQRRRDGPCHDTRAQCSLGNSYGKKTLDTSHYALVARKRGAAEQRPHASYWITSVVLTECNRLPLVPVIVRL